MKRIILLFLLFIVFQEGHAQLVRGFVLNKSDNSRINFASIYINGTNTGTNADQNGYFELDITKFASLPLTISALGYYTVTLTDFSREKPIEVYLIPETFQLNEVVVRAKSTSKERKVNLKIFRDQFLGPTYNGRNCVIKNEEDIVFKNGSSQDTLSAFAAKPIIIVNNALGYKITYYLDKFEYYRKSKSFLYKGSAFFNEDMSFALTKKDFFDKRRKNAYLGSRSHFFSSLWTNTLRSNGFVVKNLKEEIINYEDMVTMRAGFKKYLSCKDDLYIYYFSKSPGSILELLHDHVFFDNNGYFDGTGVKFIGLMAQQRIGDLLPFDYKLK